MHRIELERMGCTARGDRWRVWFKGAVLIASARDPEHGAARALLALGYTGMVEVWHIGAAHPAIRLDIEQSAVRTVVESERHGPRLRMWRPRPRTPTPIAGVRGRAGTAKRDRSATTPAKTASGRQSAAP
ncbi:MAG: hypothetical protein AB1749_11570 [Pseudomonadota bacterium]